MAVDSWSLRLSKKVSLDTNFKDFFKLSESTDLGDWEKWERVTLSRFERIVHWEREIKMIVSLVCLPYDELVCEYIGTHHECCSKKWMVLVMALFQASSEWLKLKITKLWQKIRKKVGTISAIWFLGAFGMSFFWGRISVQLILSFFYKNTVFPTQA